MSAFFRRINPGWPTEVSKFSNDRPFVTLSPDGRRMSRGIPLDPRVLVIVPDSDERLRIEMLLTLAGAEVVVGAAPAPARAHARAAGFVPDVIVATAKLRIARWGKPDGVPVIRLAEARPPGRRPAPATVERPVTGAALLGVLAHVLGQRAAQACAAD
jgi:hypothetical protein